MAETTAELIAEGKDVTTTLTDPERDRLTECESIIRKGLGTFLEVGRALAEIHDNRLYRETHNDFRRYCKDIWDLGKSSAYRKMDSYRTIKLLEDKMSPIGDISENGSAPDQIILPVNEYQTRHLLKLKQDPEAQLQAWSIVQQTLKENPKTKLTGTLVNKAVKAVRGEAKQKRLEITKTDTGSSALVSPLFTRQYQVLVDIIAEEMNNGWPTTKKSEAVKRLKKLIDIIEED
ncbi:MAG: hypothetical protein MI862_26550 [Desulfobacterales bacterium]|nr:hypothetical protein [Desulfobacterales bacterium]